MIALIGKLLAAKLVFGGAATLMALAAAFWFGQGLRLDGLSASLEAQSRALQAAAPAPRAQDAEGLRRIAAFQDLSLRPDPLAGLALALKVVRLHGVRAKAFAIDGRVITVEAPYDALGRIDSITQDLEASGAFAEVRPLTDAANSSIKIEMTLPPSASASPAG